MRSAAPCSILPPDCGVTIPGSTRASCAPSSGCRREDVWRHPSPLLLRRRLRGRLQRGPAQAETAGPRSGDRARRPADRGGPVTELTFKQMFAEARGMPAVSYTHLRAHETRHDLVCRLLLEKKKKQKNNENSKEQKRTLTKHKQKIENYK